MASFSIIPRTTRAGETRYRAQVKVTDRGKTIHSESDTFPSWDEADAWGRKRKVALEQSGAGGVMLGDPTLKTLIERYIDEYGGLGRFGRSKTYDLQRLMQYPIVELRASELRSMHLVQHIMERRTAGAGPATVKNDLVWLNVVFKVARPAWGVQIDEAAVPDASAMLRANGIIARPKRRERRPTARELDQLLEFFARKRSSIPYCDIIEFAATSARRQAEICSILWSDNDNERHTGVVRDAKHPTRKEGNHRTFKYTRAAWEIVQRQPRTDARIFPYNPKTIGGKFTQACRILEIDDLRFHDLRHEATSRLFESGYSIIEVQQFTLHESWDVLKRYTNLRPGDVKHL